MGFRRDIQGLRAAAVLLVVLFHIGFLAPGGFIGVDVFFVISGFLITSLVLRELDRDGGFDVLGFMLRRARRILPLLTVVLLACLGLLSVLHPLGPAFDDSVATARGAALLIANLVVYRQDGYFGEDPESNALLHTWSLSVEEQFYLAFPLAVAVAAWLAARRGMAARTMLGAILVLGVVVSFVLSIVLSYGVPATPLEAGARFAFLSPFTRVWQFGIGGLLAVAGGRLGSRILRDGGAVAVIGLLVIAVAATLLDGTEVYPGLLALAPTLGAVLVIAGGAGWDRRNPLASAPLVWVGDRSYGWYLWHWPLLVVGRAVGFSGVARGALLSGLALGMAAITFRAVEEPFRRVVWRRPVVAVFAAALIGGPAVVAAVVADAGTRLAAAALPAVESGGLDAADLIEFRGDRDVAPFDCLDAGIPCPADLVSPTVLVVGDSLAAALFPGLREDPALGEFRVLAAVRSGCPVLAADIATSGGPEGRCAGMLDDVLRIVGDLRPDVIVVHQYGLGYVTGVWAGEPDPDAVVASGERGATTVAGRAELYRAAFRAAIHELAAGGSAVVVVGPAPDFPAGPVVAYPTLLAAARGAEAALASEATPLGEVVERAAEVRTAEEAAARDTGARFVDAITPLCAPDGCSRFAGDLPLYRDSIHLTPAGAEVLARAVVPVVLDAVG